MSKRSHDNDLDEKFEFTERHFLVIVCVGFLIALVIMLAKVDLTTDTDSLRTRIEVIEQRLDAERR